MGVHCGVAAIRPWQGASMKQSGGPVPRCGVHNRDGAPPKKVAIQPNSRCAEFCDVLYGQRKAKTKIKGVTVTRIRTKCAVENPDSPPHDQVLPWATSIILQRVQLRANPTVCHSCLSPDVSFTPAEIQQYDSISTQPIITDQIPRPAHRRLITARYALPGPPQAPVAASAAPSLRCTSSRILLATPVAGARSYLRTYPCANCASPSLPAGTTCFSPCTL